MNTTMKILRLLQNIEFWSISSYNLRNNGLTDTIIQL